MHLLFDHNTPRGIARHLVGPASRRPKSVDGSGEPTANCWAAEVAGFDVLLTGDKNMGYQQNLSARKIALVVLGNSPWRLVRLHLDKIAAVVNAATPGSFAKVEIPFQ
jgi:hypothetical protein